MFMQCQHLSCDGVERNFEQSNGEAVWRQTASCLQGAASKSHRMSLVQLHHLRKIGTNFPSHMQTWPDNFDAHRFVPPFFPCANGIYIQDRNSMQLLKRDLAGKPRQLTCRAYSIFQPVTAKETLFPMVFAIRSLFCIIGRPMIRLENDTKSF
jgi:hypothetical protein